MRLLSNVLTSIRARLRSQRPTSRPLRRIGLLHLGWLGDHMMFAPTVRAVRAAFPQAHLTLFAGPNYQTLASALPAPDEVVTIEEPRRLGFWAIWRLLRRAQLDALLINYEFEIPARAFSLALALSGIPIRIGCGRNVLRRAVLSAPLPDRRDDAQTYLGRTFYELAEALFREARQPAPEGGLTRFLTADAAFCAPLPEDLRGVLAGCSPRLLIHPGTSAGSKRENWPKSWPPAHWATLIQTFLSRYPTGGVVLTGGPDDAEEIARIEAAFKSALATSAPADRRAFQARFRNAWGRVRRVDELATLMQACDVFVGCDSFAMHLAVYADAPQVAIFALTSERRFLPPITPTSRHQAAFRDDLACRPCLCVSREEACAAPVCLQTPVETVMAKIAQTLRNARRRAAWPA